jgi:DNA repair protein RAD51
MKDAGFNTLESIAYTAKKNLLIIKGMTEAKIDKLLEAVTK